MPKLDPARVGSAIQFALTTGLGTSLALGIAGLESFIAVLPCHLCLINLPSSDATASNTASTAPCSRSRASKRCAGPRAWGNVNANTAAAAFAAAAGGSNKCKPVENLRYGLRQIGWSLNRVNRKS